MIPDADIHSLASRELEEAALFYDQRVPGLGERFLRTVEKAIARSVDVGERIGDRELLERLVDGRVGEVGAVQGRAHLRRHEKESRGDPRLSGEIERH